ncbi:hypothetical protein EUAN_03980 [Andreesenia angusta]|uniref:HNH nuclease domain-containing protein n=1 Tax=Andreesenia angusta TaxID=39480 RepID=A0A1S1VAI4_9FIRM|nr:HNH endonuclease domain-containing protein [Andreesenia angusta]OHW63534.1 hypothetical protein EUAN_03980 [Andreesenia angusta]
MNNLNNIPKSLKVDSRYLEQMLDMKNLTNSYKILWLYSIYKEVIRDKNEATVKKLISRMVGLAWHPVIYYKLNLGVQDKISDIVLYINDRLKVSREETEEYVYDFVLNSKDKELNKKLNKISLYVPYRLVRPFYDKHIKNRESFIGRKLNDYEINDYITELLNADNKPFYRIDKKDKKIIFGECWSEYIKDNQAIIQGWLNYKLIYYLQSKNPNTPSIPFKISPPAKRDLTKAKNYWKIIRSEIQIIDIYTNKLLDKTNFNNYGEISIDHFIPWSFVLHDELWNLIPTFKCVNSSKGNNLPDLKEYYDEFCELQYRAFTIARNSNKISSNHLEDYFNVNKELYNMDISDKNSKKIFIASLKDTITPLHKIANNQGYSSWSCKG